MDLLFSLRGILAFVAFTELTTSARCFLEADSYVSEKLLTLPEADDDQTPQQQWKVVLSHSYGAWSLLNALVLLHLAIFTHYLPLASLAAAANATKIAFLLAHAFATNIVADQVRKKPGSILCTIVHIIRPTIL